MKISIIYDNTKWKEDLTSDWGFSCLVEVEDTPTILFDTGGNGADVGEKMEDNAIAIGITTGRARVGGELHGNAVAIGFEGDDFVIKTADKELHPGRSKRVGRVRDFLTGQPEISEEVKKLKKLLLNANFISTEVMDEDLLSSLYAGRHQINPKEWSEKIEDENDRKETISPALEKLQHKRKIKLGGKEIDMKLDYNAGTILKGIHERERILKIIETAKKLLIENGIEESHPATIEKNLGQKVRV